MTACAPPDAGQRTTRTDAAVAGVQVRIEPVGDPRLGTVPVEVFLLEGAGGVSGATVRVTGDMTHAGMVPVVRDAPEVEPGLYRADDFEFTMAGDWILTVDATLPGGDRRMDEARFSVPGN